jgi:hypothetical protein
MWTLTIRENITDFETVKKLAQRFCKAVKAMHPDFQYILTYEQQDRGCWHPHVAVNGVYPVVPLRTAWQSLLGGVGSSADAPGNIDITTRRSQHALSNYMSKYMVKELEANTLPLGAHRYAASLGIRKTIKIVKRWFDNIGEILGDFGIRYGIGKVFVTNDIRGWACSPG